ncbi:hypothetical protein TIFTF001_033644 [Ficus carica]|uniref:Uncharacterized protein n=1 Tax=Ficus carica TaxID=3494 RepID=A0AA88E2F0_FICCA|nr:hypothetical protein TIFTF001_033644 [Ficus carica]
MRGKEREGVDGDGVGASRGCGRRRLGVTGDGGQVASDEEDKGGKVYMRKKKWVAGGEKIIPPFDFKVDYVDSKYWFYNLLIPAQYLSYSHIDVALYNLRKKL